MNSTRRIQTGLGLFILLLCMARVGAAQTCASPWNSTSVYTAGMTASVNGINYTANFWTQGQNPATNNGGPGSGQPWWRRRWLVRADLELYHCLHCWKYGES